MSRSDISAFQSAVIDGGTDDGLLHTSDDADFRELRALLSGNKQRRKWTRIGALLSQLRVSNKYTNREIARHIGKHETWLSAELRYLDEIPRDIYVLREHGLGRETLKILLRFCTWMERCKLANEIDAMAMHNKLARIRNAAQQRQRQTLPSEIKRIGAKADALARDYRDLTIQLKGLRMGPREKEAVIKAMGDVSTLYQQMAIFHRLAKYKLR